ncbi:hypothetical protein Barb4_03771 [Bacteroidales bacterium Barb4]|nr:hypothetical protein Barb4_04827 [Bacteroidales bacterium Barb4]OAV64900.1 hypothetical protein Barb4_03771 [Bacteroidales bacterium Barb4]
MGSNFGTPVVQQFDVRSSISIQVERQFERAVLVLLIQYGSYADVLNMLRMARVQVAVASNARHAEDVLIFQISAVTPAKHLKGYQILSRMQKARQIELGFQTAVLAVTGKPPVYPDGEVGHRRPEMSKDFFPRPTGRNDNFLAVGTDMIILHRETGRIVLELASPRIADIHIYIITVAVHLPYSGNRQFIPPTVVIIRQEEISRTGIGIFHPVEFPRAVERHKVRRCLPASRQGSLFRFVGKVSRVHGRTVQLIDLRVLPFRLLSKGCRPQ